MDTQNDGLAKVDSFKIWPFLVSMLDFWGVYNVCFLILQPFVPPTKQVWQGPMNMVSGAHMFKNLYMYTWYYLVVAMHCSVAFGALQAHHNSVGSYKIIMQIQFKYPKILLNTPPFLGGGFEYFLCLPRKLRK